MSVLAKFYEEGLELSEPSHSEQNHIGYKIDNTYFGFDQRKPFGKQPGAITLWFTVDDIKKTFKKFQQLGAEIHFGPTKKPWDSTIAVVSDLDGNILGLEQRKE
jgi:predicted enzyme related to lactoylglutathione lyase